MKHLFVNGFKQTFSVSSMARVHATLLKSLLKKCAMVFTSVVCVTPSCAVTQTFCATPCSQSTINNKLLLWPPLLCQHMIAAQSISTMLKPQLNTAYSRKVSFSTPVTQVPLQNSPDSLSSTCYRKFIDFGHANSLFSVMTSCSIFRTNVNLSHLSSAARHLIRKMSSAPMGGV